jgi:hypothetical protein
LTSKFASDFSPFSGDEDIELIVLFIGDGEFEVFVILNALPFDIVFVKVILPFL